MNSPASDTKILVFIPAYQAENHLESVVGRIPAAIFQATSYKAEVLIIDDCSADRTTEIAQALAATAPYTITAQRNAQNLGYGGNQKKAYRYAIDHGFTAVVMVHGDGQYAPELLPEMIAPVLENAADCVLGSRMLERSNALKGGMPFYKWVGNQVLTFLQNKMLRAHLSEFHTGYRTYTTRILQTIPFERNSDWFDFDTEILIQLIAQGARITEIAIPTHYGDEICRVNGLLYAFKVLKASAIFRCSKKRRQAL